MQLPLSLGKQFLATTLFSNEFRLHYLAIVPRHSHSQHWMQQPLMRKRAQPLSCCNSCLQTAHSNHRKSQSYGHHLKAHAQAHPHALYFHPHPCSVLLVCVFQEFLEVARMAHRANILSQQGYLYPVASGCDWRLSTDGIPS